MKIKLGVIFGGNTTEHEVSIISAVQAMNAIDTEIYDIYPIYIGKDLTMYYGKFLTDIEVFKDMDMVKRYSKKIDIIRKDDRVYLQAKGLLKFCLSDIDVFFPIVHGNNVEDGSIQGMLRTLNIPFVGSDILGSALGQDKVIQKQLFESLKLDTPKYTWFYEHEYLSNKSEIIKEIKKLGKKYIIKPATLGSSIGITVATNETELENSIIEALKYDNKILVEEVIDNLVEINCSVLGDEISAVASVLEEVKKSEAILSYKDKYIGGTKGGKSKGMVATNREIPANLDKKTTTKIQEMAVEVFRGLNLSGVARIDFLYDKKAKKVYVNEPNTIPGSLSFYLWEKTDKPYKELLTELINIAVRKYKNKAKKISSFETNILSACNGLKGSKGKLK